MVLKQNCPHCDKGWITTTERLPCGGCLGSGIVNGHICAQCRGSKVYTRKVRSFCPTCQGSGKL
jgi:hypothetical protein